MIEVEVEVSRLYGIGPNWQLILSYTPAPGELSMTVMPYRYAWTGRGASRKAARMIKRMKVRDARVFVVR